MNNPYSHLPPTAFWKASVEQNSPLDLNGIYSKKWDIHPDWRIATAGSCFAQHIARFMRQHNYKVMDVEPPPPILPVDEHAKFGFSMYSARYGNIYTTRQLLQLVKEAVLDQKPHEVVWEKDGRFFDAFRPSIEPDGLLTEQDVLEHRAFHIDQVRHMFKNMDLFVFTMGLTEAWLHSAAGTIYPTAPGTIAGTYDPELYHFHNFSFLEVYSDLIEALKILEDFRGRPFKTLLTVSPVPLTATASGEHVLRATMHSKAALRAVAGQINTEREDVDYFPSYEIITNPAARGVFFASNLRSVTSEGVNIVMKSFFSEHALAPTTLQDAQSNAPDMADVQCEEAMLEAFGNG